jgi:hypothetical protein
MALQPYQPPPVPDKISPELRRFLEEELASIAEIINHLLQYNEDNP